MLGANAQHQTVLYSHVVALARSRCPSSERGDCGYHAVFSRPQVGSTHVECGMISCMFAGYTRAVRRRIITQCEIHENRHHIQSGVWRRIAGVLYMRRQVRILFVLPWSPRQKKKPPVGACHAPVWGFDTERRV
jgi:hypothetical protein